MNRLPLFTVCLLIVTSCGGQSQSQNAAEQKPNTNPKLVKNHFTDEQTLLYWSVVGGLQTKTGDLWFITSGEGVYRYDGHRFTNYTTKDGLSSNTICSMIEDKDGNIWFGTRDGASRYDGKTFTRFPILETDREPEHPKNNTFPRKNQVWSILQDRAGKIWFGTSEGVYIYDNSRFTRFLEHDSVINNSGLKLRMVHCMYQDSSDNIWFCSAFTENEGACRYDGRSLTSVKPNGDGWVRSIVPDRKGTLYFVTRHKGLCRYDGSRFTNISAEAGINDEDITSLTFDRAGNMWVATESGSGYLDEKGGLWRFTGKSFRHFTTEDGIPHNGVFSVTEDRIGNLWIGTRNTGLCRYDGTDFQTFSE